MNRIVHFILSHSIFIALSAAMLSVQTFQLLHLPVQLYRCLLIGFATLAGYNAYWIVSRINSRRETPWQQVWLHSHAANLLIVLSIGGMIWCMEQVQFIWYNILLTAFLLFLYALPLLPLERFHFARRLGMVKTVLLAFVWTHVTILIPLQKILPDLSPTESWLFLNRFCFVLLLCILFDKRDAAIDLMRGLHSLATDLSPLWLHGFSAATWSLYWISLWKMEQLQVGFGLPLIVAGIACAVVYLASFRKRGYVFYYFVVDGMLFLSALLTTLASI